MGESRFDAISRFFSTAFSRRGFTRFLGGAAAGGLFTALGAPEAIAEKRIGGSPCRKDDQCRTNKCVGRKGNMRCTCSQKFPRCTSGFCVSGTCAPCQRCYVLDGNGACTRTQDPMNGRCPCGFTETADGQCVKNSCKDCFENVGGICVPEPAGTAPNGRCQCGFTEVGGICVPRYPLPPQ